MKSQKIGSTVLNDKKVAIQFSDKESRVRGTGLLFLLDDQDGFAQSLGKGRYIISDYLCEYLHSNGVRFETVEMPPKLKNAE